MFIDGQRYVTDPKLAYTFKASVATLTTNDFFDLEVSTCKLLGFQKSGHRSEDASWSI